MEERRRVRESRKGGMKCKSKMDSLGYLNKRKCTVTGQPQTASYRT